MSAGPSCRCCRFRFLACVAGNPGVRFYAGGSGQETTPTIPSRRAGSACGCLPAAAPQPANNPLFAGFADQLRCAAALPPVHGLRAACQAPPRRPAGTPLVSSRGHRLGSLCIFDLRPRRLSADALNLLACLAEMAARLLEEHQVGEEKKRKNKYARRMD